MAAKKTDISPEQASAARPKRAKAPAKAGAKASAKGSAKGGAKASKGKRTAIGGKRGTVAHDIREGRVLSLSFFKRHAWFIIIALVVVIALIGQRYSNQTKAREIRKLNKELALEKSRQINEKAAYMSLIRENTMRQLLREKHLDLDYRDKPPYVLTTDGVEGAEAIEKAEAIGTPPQPDAPATDSPAPGPHQ